MSMARSAEINNAISFVLICHGTEYRSKCLAITKRLTSTLVVILKKEYVFEHVLDKLICSCFVKMVYVIHIKNQQFLEIKHC